MTKRKPKKQFGLVNLMKGLTKKEQKAIAKEEEAMEELEEKEEGKKKKKSNRMVLSADLPKDDYDFILGFARQDGNLADKMSGEDYVDYLLHRPRKIKKEEA